MVAGFFGPGVEAVRYITGETTDIGETRPDHLGRVARSSGPPQIVLLEQRDGPPIVLQLAAPDGWDYSFFLALTTDHGVEPVILKSDEASGGKRSSRVRPPTSPATRMAKSHRCHSLAC